MCFLRLHISLSSFTTFWLTQCTRSHCCSHEPKNEFVRTFIDDGCRCWWNTRDLRKGRWYYSFSVFLPTKTDSSKFIKSFKNNMTFLEFSKETRPLPPSRTIVTSRSPQPEGRLTHIQWTSVRWRCKGRLLRNTIGST